MNDFLACLSRFGRDFFNLLTFVAYKNFHFAYGGNNLCMCPRSYMKYVSIKTVAESDVTVFIFPYEVFLVVLKIFDFLKCDVFGFL